MDSADRSLVTAETPSIEASLQQLCRELGLRRLSARQKKALWGKWCTDLPGVSARAAACLEDPQLGATLSEHLGYDGPRLRQKQARYARLQQLRGLLRQLDEELSDTIMAERAELFDLTSGVLRLAQALCENPLLVRARAILGEPVKQMRRALDARNQRIAKTRRGKI